MRPRREPMASRGLGDGRASHGGESPALHKRSAEARGTRGEVADLALKCRGVMQGPRRSRMQLMVRSPDRAEKKNAMTFYDCYLAEQKKGRWLGWDVMRRRLGRQGNSQTS